MYNAIFGENPAAGALLACLDMTRQDFGRFRDVWLTSEHIAVYTRNGGGNRECWHASDPEFGDRECKHHVIQKEADVYAFMPRDQWPDGKAPGNIFTSHDGVPGCEYKTGEKQIEDFYVCENPGSPDCRCVGCFMTYHVHNLPHYSHDSDDDYDYTYATIYFHFPEEYATMLKSLSDKEAMSGDERWGHFFEMMKAKVTA